MATQPLPPTLPCKECEYVNEPERVYCHNCGAKLDRSLLPKEDQMRREPPERARRRIMRMTNPSSTEVKAWVFGSLKAVIWGLVAAAVVMAAQEPGETPPAKADLSLKMVSSDLSTLIASTQPKQMTFTQADLNAFLASGKVKKQGSIPGVEYVRSFLNLEPGTCRITIQRTIFGYPLYIGTLYRAESTDGVYYQTNIGGNVGKLPIHPLLMRYLSPLLFHDLATALKPELEEISKVTYLRIGKGGAILATSGAKP